MNITLSSTGHIDVQISAQPDSGTELLCRGTVGKKSKPGWYTITDQNGDVAFHTEIKGREISVIKDSEKIGTVHLDFSGLGAKVEQGDSETKIKQKFSVAFPTFEGTDFNLNLSASGGRMKLNESMSETLQAFAFHRIFTHQQG